LNNPPLRQKLEIPPETGILTGGEVNRAKPSTDIFVAAAERLNLAFNHCEQSAKRIQGSRVAPPPDPGLIADTTNGGLDLPLSPLLREVGTLFYGSLGGRCSPGSRSSDDAGARGFRNLSSVIGTFCCISSICTVKRPLGRATVQRNGVFTPPCSR
jgi:hypothetical protein